MLLNIWVHMPLKLKKSTKPAHHTNQTRATQISRESKRSTTKRIS